MNEPLDELYLTWLYGLISSVKSQNPSRTYWSLARQLFTKEFVWIVPNDDNRVVDGQELRREFLEESEFDEVDPDWMMLGCSVLEMLIGLSRRLAFEDGRNPRGWFWRLIDNLDLEEYTDNNYSTRRARRVDETLDRIIWRTYNPDGQGGLFPLDHPKRDQRDVELWYQMAAYLLEQG